MTNSVDVKMDESALVKTEAGCTSGALPVGQSSGSEPDEDTRSNSTTTAASESLVEYEPPPRSESNDKPQLYMDDKREWIWSGKKGWFEAVVQYRIDQERRRLRQVLWRATEKGRPGRCRRAQTIRSSAPIIEENNASDSTTGYQWKRSSYSTTGFRSVKKVHNKQQLPWWKKGRW